jgi:hypothetical protein
MALAYLTSIGPTRITVTIRDNSSKGVTKTFVVPVAVWNPATDLWADLLTIRDNLVTALNAVLDGLIYRVNVIVGQQEDAAVQSANACEVEDIASVVLNLATLGKTAVLQIPTPVIGVFKGASGKDKNRVDVTDADLNALVDLFQTTGGTFVLSDGEFVDDTTPIDDGKRISRGSTRI